MEDPYTNREIAEKFNEIKETLARIENQTTKTNVRVSRLEGWKQWAGGGIAVIVLVVFPLMSWMLYRVSTIGSTVQVAVSQALLPYRK